MRCPFLGEISQTCSTPGTPESTFPWAQVCVGVCVHGPRDGASRMIPLKSVGKGLLLKFQFLKILAVFSFSKGSGIVNGCHFGNLTAQLRLTALPSAENPLTGSCTSRTTLAHSAPSHQSDSQGAEQAGRNSRMLSEKEAGAAHKPNHPSPFIPLPPWQDMSIPTAPPL